MKLLLRLFLVLLLATAVPFAVVRADDPPATAIERTAPREPILKTFGIIQSSQSAQIFDKVADAAALEKGVGFFVKDAIEKCRAEAVKMGKTPNSIAGMAGQWLELSLLVALKHKGLTPAYFQFELHGVADAVMDVAVFSETRGPIVLSCKTSLRERYKQAEQEALATKKTFPDSYSCVVTIDANKSHVENLRKKIERKELKGLEAVFDETNLDKLFEWLAKEKLIEPTDRTLKRARLVVR